MGSIQAEALYRLMLTDIDRLGDRMKMLEANTQSTLVPGQPVIVRLDGKGFSRFCKGMTKPYDKRFRKCMVKTMVYLCKQWNAVCGYTQSDEITLLLRNEVSVEALTLSGIPFSGRTQKLVSLTSAKASTYFSRMLDRYYPEMVKVAEDDLDLDCEVLDSRAYSVPDETWGLLSLVWRELDCTKNAITQAALCAYSAKELFKKGSTEKLEMLARAGVDYEEYPAAFRRGVFVFKKRRGVMLTEEELARIPVGNRPTGLVDRAVMEVGSLRKRAVLLEYADLMRWIWDERSEVELVPCSDLR